MQTTTCIYIFFFFFNCIHISNTKYTWILNIQEIQWNEREYNSYHLTRHVSTKQHLIQGFILFFFFWYLTQVKAGLPPSLHSTPVPHVSSKPASTLVHGLSLHICLSSSFWHTHTHTHASTPRGKQEHCLRGAGFLLRGFRGIKILSF